MLKGACQFGNGAGGFATNFIHSFFPAPHIKIFYYCGSFLRDYRFHRGETDSLVSDALAFLRLSLLRFAAEQRRPTEGESKPHSCSLRVPLSVFLARSKLGFPSKSLLI